MNPTDRIIETLNGEILDRVPTFLAGIEDRTFNEILGKPWISNIKVIQNPIVQKLFDKWGPQLSKNLLQPFITEGMKKRIKASVELGFDSTWGIYDETFTAINSKTMVRYTGSSFEIRNDGYGNATYFYDKPAITNREEYENWPYWPDPDKLAKNTYKFYKKMLNKYSDKICIIGQGPMYGLFESLFWTLGAGNLARWVRKEKDLVQDYIEKTEEILYKCMMAMMDAGVKIILQTDDMAFKNGPMMRPSQIEDLFGKPYSRLTKAVHERGGKYIQHSCGDNTELFPSFIKWGFDGVHALENTSNLDIAATKKNYGEKLTLIGGIGMDYILSEKSTDEEVYTTVKEFIELMAPGGRFIIGPVHSETTIPARKLKIMLDAVDKYGKY